MTPEDQKTLSEIEKEHINEVLKSVRGQMTRAAKILGISRGGLYRKITDHQIDVTKFKGTE